MKIADILGYGRGAALKRSELEAISGENGRAIRKMIEQERRAGTLILSDNRTGYYLAADEAEAQAFVASMRHRAGEVLKTARAVEVAAKLD